MHNCLCNQKKRDNGWQTTTIRLQGIYQPSYRDNMLSIQKTATSLTAVFHQADCWFQSRVFPFSTTRTIDLYYMPLKKITMYSLGVTTDLTNKVPTCLKIRRLGWGGMRISSSMWLITTWTPYRGHGIIVLHTSSAWRCHKINKTPRRDLLSAHLNAVLFLNNAVTRHTHECLNNHRQFMLLHHSAAQLSPMCQTDLVGTRTSLL